MIYSEIILTIQKEPLDFGLIIVPKVNGQNMNIGFLFWKFITFGLNELEILPITKD